MRGKRNGTYRKKEDLKGFKHKIKESWVKAAKKIKDNYPELSKEVKKVNNIRGNVQ